jgi:glucose/arabinose dehydrogenase
LSGAFIGFSTGGSVSEPRVLLDGLNFPTSLAFAEDGTVFVAESGLGFGGAPPGGRVWRFDGTDKVPVADGLSGPVTGLCWHQGVLYVSEGGAGRITRIDAAGARTVLVEGMPGPGNYHTNMVAAGPDGKLYFSQGAMTNMGVIGLDAYELGWLRRLPHDHDVPGIDVVLDGVNLTTRDPRVDDPAAVTTTGAFVEFGTPTEPRQRIPARIPATAAVMRCDPDGRGLELVAWGLRNAFGLGFLPDGRLLAVDQGPDDRGSRPVANAPDFLFDVRPGAWYGWPDFIGGLPVTDPTFTPERGPKPTLLLANHAELPPPQRPLVAFTPHAAATKFAVVPDGVPAVAGHLMVTLFGDEAPMTLPAGKGKIGRTLVRVDPADWSIHRASTFPPLHRPIDVGFTPDGRGMYLLDFGDFEMSDHGVQAGAGTGNLWLWDDWLSALS